MAKQGPAKEYYWQNRDKCKNYNNAYYKKKREEILQKRKSIDGKWIIYRTCAKQRGLGFELKRNEFEQLVKGNCYYCGEQGGGIDRIDSNQGYIANNCRSCCLPCNRAKNDRTEEEFYRWIDRVFKVKQSRQNSPL